MKTPKKKRLERAGWRVGSAEAFLGLSREEAELVELKLALREFLKRQSAKHHLSQERLADRIGSSQSRIAKLETGLRGVSLDLLFRALFATGATKSQIGRQLQHRKRRIA